MGEAKSKKGSKPTVEAQKTSTVSSATTTTSRKFSGPKAEMTYGMTQYKYVFIGLGLIALGMILMSGGWMPSPDVWDESIIYSSRRLVLAPICILAGLVMQVFAIFKV